MSNKLSGALSFRPLRSISASRCCGDQGMKLAQYFSHNFSLPSIIAPSTQCSNNCLWLFCAFSGTFSIPLLLIAFIKVVRQKSLVMKYDLPPKSLLIMGSWRHFNQRGNILMYSACYCEDAPLHRIPSHLWHSQGHFIWAFIFHFFLPASVLPDSVKTAVFTTNYSPKSENNKRRPSFRANCDGLDLFLAADHRWIIQEAAVVTDDTFSADTAALSAVINSP